MCKCKAFSWTYCTQQSIMRQHPKHQNVKHQHLRLNSWPPPTLARFWHFLAFLPESTSNLDKHTASGFRSVPTTPFACCAAAAPSMSVAQRGKLGLAVLLLALCITRAQCIISDLDELVNTLRASLEQEDEISRATARRSLLQNPDRPALNKYGGVNMTSELYLEGLKVSLWCSSAKLTGLPQSCLYDCSFN